MLPPPFVGEDPFAVRGPPSLGWGLCEAKMVGVEKKTKAKKQNDLNTR